MTRKFRIALALAPLALLSVFGTGTASGFGVFGAHMNANPGAPSISQDGSVVAFTTSATNLSLDDSDTALDIYARDTGTGLTRLVSRATGATGTKGNGESSYSSISADGRYVTFISKATNLDPADTDTLYDVYVRDLQTDTTILASRATGATGAKSNRDSFNPTLSDDGRYVAFESNGNLSPSDLDTNGDIYVRDIQTDTTTLVSRANGVSGSKANQTSDQPSISGDGRYVAFGTFATNLNAADPPGDFAFDMYVRDLVNSTTTLVSRADGATGAKANGSSNGPSLSSDGHYITFNTVATNLNAADTDTKNDVYVRDLQANTNTLASRATGAAGAKSNGESGTWIDRAISGDGHLVAFMSQASNLSPDDTETTPDIYARDTTTNTTKLVSRGTGANGINNISAAEIFSVSPDGRYVAFGSSGLDPSDPDPAGDVYIRDLQTDTTYSEGRGPPSYARPKGASPMHVPLVPAFEPCTTPNNTHGAPLSYGSCSPPVPTSSVAMVGPKSISSVNLSVLPGNASTIADEADVDLKVQINDIRPPSAIGDYAGDLLVALPLRLTDKFNGPSAKEDGTVSDTNLSLTAPCGTTADTTTGADCSLATTADTVVPGLVKEIKRTIWQLDQVTVYDGGTDGQASSTGDNTVLMRQGLFVP